MAKILGDSVLVSKPNAPMDARTEVDTLADVSNIENPAPSLIIWDKETEKHYTIKEMEEVQIEGTSYTKKVIKSVEPMIGDAPSDDKQYSRKNGEWVETELPEKGVSEAPKDGYKYVRMNGVWVRYQTELDPTLPILTVSIKSNQGVDPTIDSLKCIAKYGINEIELSSGEQINIPYGLNLTIEFPEVVGYNKPEDITVEEVAGNMTFDVEYAYIMEHVTVNVTAGDGSSVDGQTVTVISGIESLDEFGVAIMDINGNFYKDAAEWQAAGSPTPNGIAVSDGTHRFCIAKSIIDSVCYDGSYADQEYWGANGIAVDGVTIATYASAAKTDFNGIANTDAIVANITSSDDYFTKEPWSAAALCRQFTFPSGAAGYLGASGEWSLVIASLSTINTLMSAIGGVPFDTDSTDSSMYWASTQYDSAKAWSVILSTGNTSANSKNSAIRVRAFSPACTEKDVTGGKVEFKVEYGKSCTVSINAKEGDYSLPKAVSFVAGQSQRVISFNYIPLLIDTIYINNYIADSDAIVTGEMNGKAVQAIWNEGKRHLGKYVTKADGTKEMVLIKVDENDSRYFEDGTPIDVEGLGSTAFYFSKIASMAYKITQMSDNVYKIRICYKYQPDETWKFFDEMWVPVFFGHSPIYGEVEVTAGLLTNNANSDFKYLNLYDYSNLMLLLFAKYGINGYQTVEESSESGGTTNKLMNGVTLKYGNKDIYRETYYKRIKDANNTEETVFSNYMNLLGIENCLMELKNSYSSTDSYKTPIIKGIHIADLTVSNSDEENSIIEVAAIDNDGVSRAYTIQTSTSNYKDWIKSRYISDGLFTLLPKVVGASSDTYYKASSAKAVGKEGYNDSSRILEVQLGYMTGIIQRDGSRDYAYPRRKYTGAYRIETDREKFNKLTNTWT